MLSAGPALRHLELADDPAPVSLAFQDWGDPTGPAVLCVHGLTRNAHDFDPLAASLAAAGQRVIAIDVAGRGASSWLDDPAHYVLPTYVRHAARLLDGLGLRGVAFIGTSMGGLVGMALAVHRPELVARLVLNDVGAVVPAAGLAPIAAYLGRDERFASLAEVEAYLRVVHSGFGPLPDAAWAAMAHHGVRADGDGWRLSYDPAITATFQAGADVDLRPLWHGVTCPVLLLRGALSTLLTAEVAESMTRHGPPTTLVTIADIGHAPALMTPDQIALVQGWLAG